MKNGNGIRQLTTDECATASAQMKRESAIEREFLDLTRSGKITPIPMEELYITPVYHKEIAEIKNALVLIEATLDRRLAPLEGLMEELCKAWRADE